MTIISDLAGPPNGLLGVQGLENIVAIIKMGVSFKGAFSKWENSWVYTPNDVMRQFCKCTWTFCRACFLPKKKNHLLFFMVCYLLSANVTNLEPLLFFI